MSHTRFNEAVKLRLGNHLDDAQNAADRLWQAGYRTAWLALLKGNLWLDLGDYEEADRWYALAWAMVAPDNKVRPEAAHFAQDIALPLAYSRMRLGRWDAFCWSLFEFGRLGRSWHPAPGTKPWKGSADKLLILSEGGFGDVFLMTRLFQRLDPIQRAASRFVVGPQMRHLKGFAEAWDGIPAYYHDEIVDWSGFKYSTPLMSLLSFTGIRTPADIPAAEPLRVEPLSNYFVRFGLCQRAEELGTQKRIRSIDNPADLAPLQRWQFISLLPGPVTPRQPGEPHLIDANLDSWTKTARLIAGLDCVITVDSAVAHLAGLLGVKTFVILPINVDWKHGVSGGSSFWWPNWTLIRNDSPYSWKTAIEKAAELLEKM